VADPIDKRMLEAETSRPDALAVDVLSSGPMVTRHPTRQVDIDPVLLVEVIARRELPELLEQRNAALEGRLWATALAVLHQSQAARRSCCPAHFEDPSLLSGTEPISVSEMYAPFSILGFGMVVVCFSNTSYP
jgi:hypothetical protein